MVKRLIILVFAFALFISLNFVSAWEFNGTVRDTDGNLLNNTLVNLTIWQRGEGAPPSLLGSNSTFSNESGWFSIDVSENSDWMYKPVVTQTNLTTGAIEFIGQSLPTFAYREMVNISDINFYLGPAGTINITAVNSTGDRISFTYQVKDAILGYPIDESFTDSVSEAVIYLPKDRNYSIEIFPSQAIPIAFDWDNFSASEDYDLDALSNYNLTTHTLTKTFNSTDNLIRVSGYINATAIDGWDEFTVVPFLLEPGNMVYLGSNGGMPYNMSAWNNEESDYYNLSTGFYNITLPVSAESTNYILFATASNGTGYYGGYKNISLAYSDSPDELNFTMYSLMSNDWASANSNISLNGATGGSVNISSAKQQFNLLNSSGDILSNLNAHLEIKLDYSDYGAREFTFMNDLSTGDASFYLPLLNASVKEINIYSQSYSPKSISAKTETQILNNSNITMTTFNPGDIDGSNIIASVQVAMYQSNATCDLPNPDSPCIIADSASIDSTQASSFNPLSAIIGGGKINFRMGLLASGIIVEYINVDMLASGPPDALFDDSATTSTSGNFDSVMRFGSNGPTIYDHVIISMPYTEGSTSQTGLDEDTDVNMSIPILYDENWNLLWNATANGTDGDALAGNNSHYSTYSAQWETLMGENNCTRDQTEFNATYPCFIDTTNNRIWIRLPHFSGTQPSVIGDVITATEAAASTTTGGSGTTSFWISTASVTENQLGEGYSKGLIARQRIQMNISGESHYVGIINMTSTSVVINVSSTPQQATFSIGDENKFDVTNDGYYDLLIKLNAINVNTANITVKSINEKIGGEGVETSTPEISGEQKVPEDITKTPKESNLSTKIIMGIIVIILAAVIVFFILRKRTHNKRRRGY